LAPDAKKQYKRQKIYFTGVLHVDLLPFIQKNPKARSANILETNGLLTFYLAGAKHASCNISPKGTTMISYRRSWEHDAILAIVKDAMRQAGYNPENVKLERYQPAYDEIKKPYELFNHGVLNYDTNQMFLALIPELKEKLKKAKTNKFRVEDAPCLLLGAQPVFKKGSAGEIIVHATSKAKKAFYKLQMLSVFDKDAREEIGRRIKERFKSAELPFKEEWMEE
jgi:ribosomal silencing factor RsfS